MRRASPSRGRVPGCARSEAMLENDGTLGVLGCGTVGEAIVRGLIRSGSLPPARLAVSTRRTEAATALGTRHGVRATVDNLAVARDTSAVLVSLKPQQLATVLDTDDMRAALRGKLVVIVAAGVRLEQIRRWLPESPLIRAMPNTPALIGNNVVPFFARTLRWWYRVTYSNPSTTYKVPRIRTAL